MQKRDNPTLLPKAITSADITLIPRFLPCHSHPLAQCRGMRYRLSTMHNNPKLPIDDVLPDLRTSLKTTPCAVVHAPPGAGKTTRVPTALLNEPWLGGGKIIMLEPRRLAARSAATFMARQLGERVGETVGYRIRLDTKVTAATRIEVVTEGVLTRMIQSDPELTGIGCIIFDEFHERSLHADLGLALALECREVLRDDLRLLVMSATLDCAPVAKLMDECPVLSSQGRSFPVETIFLPPAKPDMDIAELTALAVKRALEEEKGSVLAFLPGAAEIHRTAVQLEHCIGDATLHQLFGALAQREQDAAIAPAPKGTRKVVLATSIAETSLTIDGIRVVIDAGLARLPRFDPSSGMTRLVTDRVSRASADQRRGRAGRLEPGICYRLWTAAQDKQLRPFPAPEIQEADLAPLVLELAVWGVTDPSILQWLDAPPQSNVEQARELLQELGAVDAAGRITTHGKQLAALPLHPRLAHMVLTAKELGLGRTACMTAALISERDFMRSGADMRSRLAKVIPSRNASPSGIGRRIQDTAERIARMAKISSREKVDVEAAGTAIALAYPDRIAQRTGNGLYRLSCGRAGWLPEEDSLAREDFLAIADLDGNAARARIWRAAPILRQEVEEVFAQSITEESFVEWDAKSEAVSARNQRKLGKVVLHDAPLKGAPQDKIMDAVLRGIRSIGLHCLPWDKATTSWRNRVAFLRSLDAPQDSLWPDVSDDGLFQTADQWLAPFLINITRRSQFKKIDLKAALTAMLSWELQQRLDKEAPTHLRVPCGTRERIDYSPESGPVLLVKLQKMFGVVETPRIAAGRHPLTIHLLSPAQRPLQITQDLKSFWENGYQSVRAEMKGRYPKHHWPDDPFA